MFLALRDIIHARGRFGLLAVVVGLITLLVVMLSGLTGGLGKHNTSALEVLNADRIAISAEGGEHSFTSSRITQEQVDAWADTASVTQASPLGTTQTTLDVDGHVVGVSVLGLPAGSALPHDVQMPDQGVLIPQTLANDYGLMPGSNVTIGGVDVQVTGVSEDEYFSHSLVVWAPTELWAEAAHVTPETVGTAIVLNGDLDNGAWDEASASIGPEALPVKDSFNALPSYQSEQGSLNLIQVFLYGISALVIISFLTVWTIQRTRDLAVLRALGAAPRYLLIDALAQAVIVLTLGATFGALIGIGLGAIASNVVPFQMDLTTTLIPAAGIVALGVVGALIAVRSVRTINPLTAFNQS